MKAKILNTLGDNCSLEIDFIDFPEILWEALQETSDIPIHNHIGKYVGKVSHFSKEKSLFYGIIYTVDRNLKDKLKLMVRLNFHPILGLNYRLLVSHKDKSAKITKIINMAIVGIEFNEETRKTC